jgi:hypothetical protein
VIYDLIKFCLLILKPRKKYYGTSPEAGEESKDAKLGSREVLIANYKTNIE